MTVEQKRLLAFAAATLRARSLTHRDLARKAKAEGNIVMAAERVKLEADARASADLLDRLADGAAP